MSITITLQQDLAERLEAEAMQRSISVEALATAILDRAVTRTYDTWGEQNQRRLILIRKSIQHSLLAEEHRELDSLQAALDARFEDFDAALISQLSQVRDVVQ